MVLTTVGETCVDSGRNSLIEVSEKQMLEDLLAAAFNDARTKADAASGAEMSKMTSGLPLPPGFKLPF